MTIDQFIERLQQLKERGIKGDTILCDNDYQTLIDVEFENTSSGRLMIIIN